MNKGNKKDVFLDAIIGTTPLEKSNRNFKINIKNKNEKNQNNKNPKINLHTTQEKKKYEENEMHTRFKMEKPNINKKLKKGMINIDKKIDFHGFTVEEARLRFIETIEKCFVTNKRCILFITGKGMNSSQNKQGDVRLYYGKIRNEFLNWTQQKTINRKILSVEQAGTTYGGDGAFFVYLRRNKN